MRTVNHLNMSVLTNEVTKKFADIVKYIESLEKENEFLRTGLNAVLASDEELQKARDAARIAGAIK